MLMILDVVKMTLLLGLLMTLGGTFDNVNVDVYYFNGALPFDYFAFSLSVIIFLVYVTLRAWLIYCTRKNLLIYFSEFKRELSADAPNLVKKYEKEVKYKASRGFFNLHAASHMDLSRDKMSTDKIIFQLNQCKNTPN